jgi:hypothetical protein
VNLTILDAPLAVVLSLQDPCSLDIFQGLLSSTFSLTPGPKPSGPLSGEADCRSYDRPNDQ